MTLYPSLDDSTCRTAAETIGRSIAGASCQDCRHLPSEHLFLLGPVRLCMDAGCACGRRALMALARRLVPFLPAAVAFGYLAYHLDRWAAMGFLVSGR